MKHSALAIDIDLIEDGKGSMEIDHPASELDLESEGFKFEGRVKGHLDFLLDVDDIYVRGAVETLASGQCVRCLAEVPFEVSAKVELVFIPQAEQSEGDVDEEMIGPIIDSYSGAYVDPASQLRDLILLELPELPLCAKDCKGLCPQCGANLNQQACACDAPETPPPAPESENWKNALRNLKID